MIYLATTRIPQNSSYQIQDFATFTMARLSESGTEKIYTTGMRGIIMDTHVWTFSFIFQGYSYSTNHMETIIFLIYTVLT